MADVPEADPSGDLRYGEIRVAKKLEGAPASGDVQIDSGEMSWPP
jgi:hypothetical protein